MYALIAAFSRPTRRRVIGGLESTGIRNVIEAKTYEDALAQASRRGFDVAFVSPQLCADPGDSSGIELVSELRSNGLPVIMVGDPPDFPTMRRAMRGGVSDWLSLDGLDDGLGGGLGGVLAELCADGSTPSPQALAQLGRAAAEQPLLGKSPAMASLRQSIARVARTHYPVLVTGPSGAGKELVVRELHRLGLRPDAVLLDLNCGAIPENLLESQLFGHKRGAFTGADRDQEGYLSAVGGGCLFLDEIAELPAALQAKLLRVLETGRYRMVGSTRECEFRGRVIAATHADLEYRCQIGAFREDLYYRLAVLEINVPSLAEHREDVPLLLDCFIAQQERSFTFSPEAVSLLTRHDWPGNVRELRNLVARVAVMCDEEVVSRKVVERLLRRRRRTEASDDALTDFADSVLRSDADDKLGAALDALIARSLERNGGNKSAAARALGVHRKVLERRLGKQRQLS